MADELSSNAIDVTALVEGLAPELLQQWGSARVFLVANHGAEDGVPTLATRNASEVALDVRRRRTSGGLAPAALRRVRHYIEEHLAEPVSLRELSAVAGLSVCHFSRAFKESVGVPPRRFVRMRRVMKAVDLVRNTDRPMAEISQEVGFADQSHFTRCFAAITRQTPRAFRRRR